MKIRTKISGMGLVLVLLTACSIVGIVVHQKIVLKEDVGQEVDLLVGSELEKVAQNVYLMCRSMQESFDRVMAHGLKVALDIGTRRGKLDFAGRPVTWKVVNQYNREPSEVVLPKVAYDGRWLGQNTDFRVSSDVVDEVSVLLGMTCTIFQRMNEAGDMLRVATTVPGSNGARAVGTYIPRYNPDGTGNQVIETLLQGKIFTGRAYVVNAWYLTGYHPLWDPSGKRVIGALYVGKKQQDINSLRHGIMDIVIGKSGYVLVVHGKGTHRGEYIISKDGSRDGENPFTTADTEQKAAIEKILDISQMIPGRQFGNAIPVVFHRYQWINPGETDKRAKIAAVSYFEPWDWLIIASAYEEDFLPVRQRMIGALSQMLKWVVALAAVTFLLSVLIGHFIARGIVRPLENAMELFEQIGQGQLDLQLNIAAEDEIGQLSRSFNRMVLNLKEVTASRDDLNHEIIERIRVEKELRETSARREELEHIVNNSPAVAFLCRAEDGWPVEYVSLNIAQFGYDADDFHNGHLLFSALVHDEDFVHLQQEVAEYAQSREEGGLVLEYRLRNRDGAEFWVENRLWLRRDDESRVTHYQGVMVDISARKEAEARIQKLAYYDSLTGLPNRPLFMDRLDQALAGSRREERLLAILFIDLDRFKEVNDQYGHALGDNLLKAAAQRLSAIIRQNDTLARLGGDEFIMMLSGVADENDVATVARKIIVTLEAPFDLDQHRCTISASVGIALAPRDGTVKDLLLKRADMAMYVAKERGKNDYCFFDPTLEARGLEEKSGV